MGVTLSGKGEDVIEKADNSESSGLLAKFLILVVVAFFVSKAFMFYALYCIVLVHSFYRIFKKQRKVVQGLNTEALIFRVCL